jgi:hypothetical protein
MNFNFQLPALHVHFFHPTEIVLFKIVYPFKIYQRTKFHGSVLQYLYPPQKFEFSFWDGLRYRIKKDGIKVTLNGTVTSLLNFIKTCPLIQELLRGGGGGDRDG